MTDLLLLERPLAAQIRIGQSMVARSRLPSGMRSDEGLGLVLPTAMTGSRLYSNPYGGLYETRCTVTPDGDFLLMFPDGLATTNRKSPNGHYGGQRTKVNRMLALRSRDRGGSWSAPFVPFDQDFNQHGFVPLIPQGTRTLCCFGTQPRFDRFNGVENAAIGWRRSEDDGRTWSEVHYIEPRDDPGFQGMSVQRMTETGRGTWLIGAHTGTTWFPHSDGWPTTSTRQYLLRSADRGATWTVRPRPRPDGWFVPASGRMDELRPISLGGDEVYAQARTTTGRIWQTRSLDDGLTWSEPAPSPLIHPDAPPMLFLAEDRETLLAFHHNSHTGSHFNRSAMTDRAQLWLSASRDGGRSWSEPRFVLANALEEDPRNEGNAWRDHQCSYIDVLAVDGMLHLFMPHRWQHAVHLQIPYQAMLNLPTAAALSGA